MKSQSPCRQTRRDRNCYAKGVRTLADNTVRSLAQKIAEKRGLDISISEYRLRLGSLKEECKRQVEVAKTLKRKIEQVEVSSYKQTRENATLRSVLQSIQEQKKLREESIQLQLSQMRIHNANLWAELGDKRKDLSQIAAEHLKEKEEIDRQRAKLEVGNMGAGHDMERVKVRQKVNLAVDMERVAILREKAKMLSTFIMSEGNLNPTSYTRESPLPLGVSKILRSPSLRLPASKFSHC